MKSQPFGQSNQIIKMRCDYLYVWCIWLYVIMMSRSSFRVNRHSIDCPIVKEVFARGRGHIWSLNDSKEIRTHNQLVRKRTLNHLAYEAKWLSYVVSTYL